MTRQDEIRRDLRFQYQQGAANELLVAKLRYEMSSLPHRHRLNPDRICAFCFYGEDAYTMPLADVLAEVERWERESNLRYDQSADAQAERALENGSI